MSQVVNPDVVAAEQQAPTRDALTAQIIRVRLLAATANTKRVYPLRRPRSIVRLVATMENDAFSVGGAR